MESVFDTSAGLPLHPLVVHFAVVLLPLATTGVLVSIYWSWFRRRYLSLSVVGVLLGTGATVVAKQSGEALARRLGLPVQHANYGTYLTYTSLFFLLLSAFWYWQSRQEALRPTPLLQYVTTTVGVLVLILAILTGHTGAEAVWKGRLNSTASASASTSSGSSTGSITKDEVAKHKSATNCWSIINGKVYNLTKWINQHPGGPVVIESLCGKDGSAGFNGQHGGQQNPQNELAKFYLSDLKKN